MSNLTKIKETPKSIIIEISAIKGFAKYLLIPSAVIVFFPNNWLREAKLLEFKSSGFGMWIPIIFWICLSIVFINLLEKYFEKRKVYLENKRIKKLFTNIMLTRQYYIANPSYLVGTRGNYMTKAIKKPKSFKKNKVIKWFLNCADSFLSYNEEMKWNTLFWGLTTVVSPFIIIYLFRVLNYFTDQKVMKFKSIEAISMVLTITILVGIYLLLLSSIGFSRHEVKFKKISIIAYIYIVIMLALIALSIPIYNNTFIFILFVLSFLIVIFNIFKMILKIWKDIYRKFIGMEESKQISLIFPIITGIFGYLIKK